jgi:hypothetical protein
MKRPWIRRLLVGLLVFTALLFLHLGPVPFRRGKDQVLSRLDLKDGTKLFLMSRWTGSLLEPYSIELFHVSPDHNCYLAFLGDEESYWWRGSLQEGDQQNSVKIFLSDEVIGTYSLEQNTFDIPSQGKMRYYATRIDGVTIPVKAPVVPAVVVDAIFAHQ